MHEKLNTVVLEGLKDKALGSSMVETSYQVAARRGAHTSRNISTYRVSMLLPVVQGIADREGRVSEQHECFKKALLERRLAMTTEPQNRHILCLDMLTEVLERVAQENMQWSYRKKCGGWCGEI